MMVGKPILRTDRLDLWCPRHADLSGLVELVAPAETHRFLGPTAPTAAGKFERMLRNAGSWSLYGYGSFMVRMRGTERIVGNCGVFHALRGFGQNMDDIPEAGWVVHHDYQGRGIAGEAMRAALAWFDETQAARRVACMIDNRNCVSQVLAAKLGFAAYGQHTTDNGDVVTLYERIAAVGSASS